MKTYEVRSPVFFRLAAEREHDAEQRVEDLLDAVQEILRVSYGVTLLFHRESICAYEEEEDDES